MRTEAEVAAMPCPVCRVPLAMSDRQGIEIDYCPQCRGVWLDRGELDKIIERSVPQAPAPAASASSPQPSAPLHPSGGQNPWSPAATRTAVTVMAQDTAATAASHTRNARVGWRKSSTEECQMHETTTADRERELRTLLDLIEAHPERAWTEERQRVAVLQRMLAANSES